MSADFISLGCVHSSGIAQLRGSLFKKNIIFSFVFNVVYIVEPLWAMQVSSGFLSGEFCDTTWLVLSLPPDLHINQLVCSPTKVNTQVPYRICPQIWFSDVLVGAMAQPDLAHSLL